MVHSLVNTLNFPALPILSLYHTPLAKFSLDDLNYLPIFCVLDMRVIKQVRADWLSLSV